MPQTRRPSRRRGWRPCDVPLASPPETGKTSPRIVELWIRRVRLEAVDGNPQLGRCSLAANVVQVECNAQFEGSGALLARHVERIVQTKDHLVCLAGHVGSAPHGFRVIEMHSG